MLLEKYRPKTFQGIVGRQDILKKIKQFVEDKDLPNLLFHGTAGVGKTLTAEVIARELFSKSWRSNFFSLNASDESGIDTIRNKVKKWAQLRSLGTSDIRFKIIFLDEADFLTMNSQTALRRLMEDYFGTCRFILSCNYVHKVIEPIKSRCACIHFKPLEKIDIRKHLRTINKTEKLKIDVGVIKRIALRCGGDMRQALNQLELASKGEEFSVVPTNLLGKDWKEFLEMSYDQDPNVLLNQFFEEAKALKNPELLVLVAETDRSLARGCTKILQLLALHINMNWILNGKPGASK